MIEVFYLLAAAAVGHALARGTGLPSAPLMILSGAVVSLAGLASIPRVQDVLVLSVSVLIFTAGASLELPAQARLRSATIRVAFVQFAALGIVGLGAATLLGYGGVASLHLAVALAASSTLLGVRVLRQRRQLFEPWGRLVVGVLLVQDLLVVLLVPMLEHLGSPVSTVTAGVGAALLLTLAAVVARQRVMPSLFGRLDLDSEAWLLVFLGVLFGFLGLGALLGVSPVTSAFLAGLSLSRFPVRPVAVGQMSALTAFFSALFFTGLGTWIVLPRAVEILHGALLAALVVVVTPPVVTIVAERRGFTARAGLLSGLILSQTSELSLVIVLQGTILGLLEPRVFTVVALATVFTMAATPLLATDRMARLLLSYHPLRKRAASPTVGGDHVLLLGCGSTGMEILDLLFMEGVPTVVVESDPAVVSGLSDAGIPAVRGDATDATILRSAGIGDARVVVSTLRQSREAGTALSLAGDVPVLVRAFDDEEERWIRDRGGIAVSYADATAQNFFHWFRSDSPIREERP